MMNVLIIYILFAILNIIICSILAYIDYNNGEEITLGTIYIILGTAVFSLFGTIWIIICILNEFSDIVILQNKKNEFPFFMKKRGIQMYVSFSMWKSYFFILSILGFLCHFPHFTGICHNSLSHTSAS